MRVPISWLREFVALPNDSQMIAARLAMLGFPVEAIERRPQIHGVLTGQIASVEKHSNADRLLVARVEVARHEPLTIATAAANVATGQIIAVATVGAKLPGLTIEARTMRGVTSHGMMISAEELALPPEWFEDGIMQLDSTISPGIDVVELFGLNADVLEVEITANRPDSLSMLGLARELAASYGTALKEPSLCSPVTALASDHTSPAVSIESSDCLRFVVQRFEDVRVQTAPAWMRVRLALAGQRPINNLVDISNYVMLETGQPLHFYDADAITGDRLIVRDAREGEKLVTLDRVERTLQRNALVIADGERALGLAGLMGGSASEVTPSTTAIVLEAANFDGPRVRRMSAALGLRSEASSRHEKGLALALTDFGAARAAQFLFDFGATGCPPKTFGAPIVSAPPIELSISEVERLLGFVIPSERITVHLRALGCEVTKSGEILSVTPPPWRRDLTIGADLVEEVARIEGYDEIPALLPTVPPHEISSSAFTTENCIARALAALGYREIITHSLRASGEAAAIPVRNPLSEDRRFLRESLMPGLIDYLGNAAVPSRRFEIGDVFARDGEDVTERSVVAFGFSANHNEDPPWHDSFFLRLKGDCEALLREVCGPRAVFTPSSSKARFHPGKTAAVALDGVEIGFIGCVDPRVTNAHGMLGNIYLCELDIAALPPYKIPQYRPQSRFPSTYRDLALVVQTGVSARDVEEVVTAALGDLCTSVTVFDEYRGPQVGPDRKSIAVRVTLQRFDTTITDEEADAAVSRVLQATREQLGATIRT